MRNTIKAWKYWNNFVPCLDKGDEWAVMVYIDLNAYTVTNEMNFGPAKTLWQWLLNMTYKGPIRSETREKERL